MSLSNSLGRSRKAALWSAMLSSGLAMAAAPLHDASVAPAFFNPTLGQTATISCTTGAAGTLTVEILDRDGFVIRTIPAREVKAGRVDLNWDGRDDSGAIVADEAFTTRLALKHAGGTATLDPLAAFKHQQAEIQPVTFSAVDGTFSYRLLWPARLHMQVGQAVLNKKTGRNEGPVLKTIVDREPRAAGSVVERWNGFDESATIRVAELPHFVVSVFATHLPEPALITTGNRSETYRAYALRRRPASAAPRKVEGEHQHHAGLTVFEDQTPTLRIDAAASRDQATGLPVVDRDLAWTATLAPANAAYFLAKPADLCVFVDEKKVGCRVEAKSPATVTIPRAALSPGEHRIALNWISGSGPTAVQAVRVLAR